MSRHESLSDQLEQHLINRRVAREFEKDAAESRRLERENAKLRALVETLLDNDPDEPIADNGGTVLDMWRQDAKRALGRV